MTISPRRLSGEKAGRRARRVRETGHFHRLSGAAWLFAVVLIGSSAMAQVNVVTAHNDIGRTGQNLQETILTPSNVNPSQFGKLFSQPVNGEIFGQPLYVSGVAIPGMGTHNVLYVTTTSGDPNAAYGKYPGDTVYAFDADTNGGINANPLWEALLANRGGPAGTYTSNIGVVGTPVIDLPSQTIYVVSSELQSSVAIHRLHALDITTGAEKFGGPVLIQGSLTGTGTGSVSGVLSFDSLYETQRPALLFLNGVLYIAFGSHADEGPWHGWMFSYNPTTLQQIALFCTNRNGSGAGIWMGGAGLAAEVNNPAKPYGRMFLSTGNGTFGIYAPTISGQPLSNPSNRYGMSILDLDLTGGQMTVEDYFTPFNEAALNGQDGDLGSGGLVLLPTQNLASGKTLNPLIQIGKSGMFYILDRDNNNDGSNNAATEYTPAGLGGFNTASDQIVQEVQTPISPTFNWGAGVWGSGAYWNNNLYFGGTNVAHNYSGTGNGLTAYSFINGVLSSTPTSNSAELFAFPGPTPSVSANGTSNGIVWVIKADPLNSPGYETLLGYDATNLANTLYSSNNNLSRDNPGLAVAFTAPTIANGKVYVGANGEASIYGLLSTSQTAPAPVISPSSRALTTTQQVTITDAVAGATIYYTTNGTMPTSSSAVYNSATPLVVSSTETITAIASPNGYVQSPAASATFTLATAAANPIFSVASGTYAAPQTLTITDSTPGAVVYYTLNGSTPTSASAVYAQPLSLPISVGSKVEAIAIAPSLIASSVVSATYTIQQVYTIDFSDGFTLADGPIQFNGSTDLDDFRLQLTNGITNEAGSAFYATPVNIQSFSTFFTFQLSNPGGDGMTFTIQGVGPTALGNIGSGLGYSGINRSVAIKFDMYSNSGEGPDSTGLYLNGARPTVPAIDLSSTGIDLHSGNFIDANITYDGNTLNMTLTDEITRATWSQSFKVNIPSAVGGNTAYVGFTGGTGGLTSSQKLLAWTYLAGAPLVPNYPAGFDSAGLTLNGGTALNGSRLRLTDGNANEARSAFFSAPVNVQQFTTSFNFQNTNANADGFTFAIQGVGPTAVEGQGGALGYTGMRTSVAVKFDLFSNKGEGPDSTGLYTKGASPMTPAIDLSSTGINLHSGDIFNVQMTYNGTTLTVVITDTVTNATATQTYTVNIPSLVGGPTAYVGYTAGSGGTTAVQDILNWTYSSKAYASAQ